VIHIREGLGKDAFASLRDQWIVTPHHDPEGFRIASELTDDSTFAATGHAFRHGETEPILS